MRKTVENDWERAMLSLFSVRRGQWRRQGIRFRSRDDEWGWFLRVADGECELRDRSCKGPMCLHHDHHTGEPIAALCVAHNRRVEKDRRRRRR